MTLEGRPATPLLPITRFTFVVAAVLVFIAGVQLFVLSRRTDEFFAWTIRNPLTAAFLGAGYWANLAGLLPGARLRLWQQARIQMVATLAFTLAILFVTLRDLRTFHFDDADLLPRLAAWAWLVVYLGLPVLLMAVLVIQERAGGSREYAVEAPLRPWLRGFFLVQTVALGGLGLGLIFLASRFDAIWPWQLNRLAAGAIGSWLIGIAAGSIWVLRDGDWRRTRLLMPTYLAFCLLQLIAVARFSDQVQSDDWRTWVYIGWWSINFGLFAIAWWQHEERSTADARGGLSEPLTPEAMNAER